jgi:hypothetical protein
VDKLSAQIQALRTSRRTARRAVLAGKAAAV